MKRQIRRNMVLGKLAQKRIMGLLKERRSQRKERIKRKHNIKENNQGKHKQTIYNTRNDHN